MSNSTAQRRAARLGRAVVKGARFGKSLWQSWTTNYSQLSHQKLAIISLSRVKDLREAHIIHIFRLLQGLGFTSVYYWKSRADLQYLSRLDSDIVASGLVTFSQFLPDSVSNSVLLCDDPANPLMRLNWRHILQLEFNLSQPRSKYPDALHIPYPDRSAGYLLPQLIACRQNPKTIRSFFSGSYRGYKNRPVGRFLNLLERAEVTQLYRDCEFVQGLNSLAELEQKLVPVPHIDLSPGMYFVDTDKFRVPQADWFRVLSQVDVFLCPPGIDHPISHNLVEALAVGAIPLLNYPEWLHPRLEDGINCFVFKSAGDLQAKLMQIKDLSPAVLTQMQQNALAYYQQNLDPQVFLNQLTSRLESPGPASTHLIMQTDINDYFPLLTSDSLALNP